jgi:hypothetical protein
MSAEPSLKPCKSCNKDVAKSARKCPHCGQKLKMGMFAKVSIAILALVIIMIFGQPTNEDLLQQLAKSEVSNLQPGGKLADAFKINTTYTDLQREELINKHKGKVVVWRLPVYEVRKLSEGKYRLQTSWQANTAVGAFATIYPQSDDDVKRLNTLKTGDWVKVKGKITGVMLRNIELEPAVLAQ